MENWRSFLTFDPLDVLLSSQDEALTSHVRRDLLDEDCEIKNNSKEIEQIIRKQQSDGSWIFHSSSKVKYPSINHNLIETFKSLRILVGKYKLNKTNANISKSIDYVFSCQSVEGDIRGILGNQYMPYFCGLLLEYIIKAGYSNDKRVEKAFEWLINSRQDDGGWVIPLQTVKVDKLDDSTYSAPPIVADKSLPSSHLATGMVLRAFATHEKYKKSEVAQKAGNFLKNRFFRADKYNDRKAADYWLKFQFPYWWTTLVSSLDSLYSFGFTMEDKEIEKVIEWLLINQRESGLWTNKYDKGDRDRLEMNTLWIAYDICRILKLYLNTYKD